MTEPTIDDLHKLAKALGQPLSRFFGQPEAAPEEIGYIVRAGARRSLGTEQGGLVAELLSPDLGGAFEVLHVVFAPGAEREDPTDRPTEDAAYIIAGRLDVWISGRLFQLAAGDSFCARQEPVRWRNPGSVPCVAIWVAAPPIF